MPSLNLSSSEPLFDVFMFNYKLKNLENNYKSAAKHSFPVSICQLRDLLQVALDYIGKRGATVGVTREKRIKYVFLEFFDFDSNSILVFHLN